ncbi:MAG: GIY-YIG nuclease family protein [bacterium]|nr:GIY-YIG nuclease family protein [bacterium]
MKKEIVTDAVHRVPADLPPHQIMFYVYVLKSKKDMQLYVGSTNDLRKRFKEHNDGKIFSTKTRRPFELVYYEAYKSEKDARVRESNLKLRSRAFTQLKKRIENSVA